MKNFFLISALLLSACSDGHYQYYLNRKNISPPTTEQFIHCYDYGCKTKAQITLPSSTENKLRNHFKPAPKDATSEQKKIATAIQIFENDIGALTGTKNDKHGTFRLYQDDAETTRSHQQDCVDESTNTTIYLALLEQMELLKFHRPVFPASRQPFLGGGAWWHQTAVMENIETGEKYAVDSWFRDNGNPAFIVPLKEWLEGWKPPKEASKG